jgi:hypothetical protein
MRLILWVRSLSKFVLGLEVRFLEHPTVTLQRLCHQISGLWLNYIEKWCWIAQYWPFKAYWLRDAPTGVTQYWLFKAYWLRDAPTGLTSNNCILCPHCIYMFCIYLRPNSDLCHLQHKLIVFITEMKSVYSAVRTGSINNAVCASSING